MSVSTPHRHRFSVADFHRMAAVGILSPDDRVELIEGELIRMAPMGNWHAFVVSELHRLLLLGLGERAVVRSQTPLVLGTDSEPEPDVLVLRRRDDQYRDALPEARDVQLLVAVADTTLEVDRGVKLSLYARHGVPEVWIVNRRERQVEMHRQPVAGRYGDVRLRRTGLVAPADFPGLAIAVEGLF